MLVAAIAWSALAVWLAVYCLYQLWLNPLAKVPGPRLLALTQLPWFVHNFRGNLPFWLSNLHEQYGPAVRIGPHEVSFLATSLQTWKTIRGKRPEMPKSEGGTGLLSPDLGAEVSSTGSSYLIVSSTEVHRRMRGALEPAFRDSALREQEGILLKHVDQLVGKVQDACAQASSGAAKVDTELFYSLFTFDLAGDLLFGKDFCGLENVRHDAWYATFFDTIQAMSFGQMATYYKLAGILTKLTPKPLADSAKLFWNTSEKMVDQRLDEGRSDGRKDWISYFEMQHEKDSKALEGVSRKELHKNAGLLLVTGSDTSGAAMSGLLFHLCANPKVYEKLVTEVRTRFRSAQEVDMSSIGDCEYLGYCIQESLRLYPPGPATIPHVVNQPGEIIEGFHVPLGTVVGIHPYSTFRSPRNFHKPAHFVPERWLPRDQRPEAHLDDNLEVVQSFSFGPRNCIGQRLAQIMLRLVFCTLLLRFNFKLCDESKHWNKQRGFLTWERPPLMVCVSEAKML